MHKYKLVCLLLTAALLCGVLCGCGDEKGMVAYLDADLTDSVQTQRLAENERLALSWNDTAKCVLLTDKQTGKIWSGVPSACIDSGEITAMNGSVLNISVVQQNSGTLYSVGGFEGLNDKGRILSEAVENGIKVTYCFDEQEIAVTVVYTLRTDSLCVTLDFDDIIEAGEYQLQSVALNPMLMAAANDAEDAYILLPVGSGALISTGVTVDGTQKFTADVYGMDAAELRTSKMTDEATLNMPVFGVKENDSALFAIVEQGAEMTGVSVESGNQRAGYSYVYPTVTVHGMDGITPETVNLTTNDAMLLSEERNQGSVSIGYYPLAGEDADYTGMANCYRNYLERQDGWIESAPDAQAYSLRFYGGSLISKTFLGVSYKKLSVLTELEDVREILETMNSTMGAPASVELYGFGSGGVFPSRAAGGFGIDSAFGSRKDYAAVQAYCKTCDTALYTDFDLVFFRKSGSGYSTLTDAAKSATLRRALLYNKALPLLQNNEDFTYYLLGRGQLRSAAEDLLKKANKSDWAGVAFSSLGAVAYSDYREAQYSGKANMAADVAEIFASFREDGHSVATSAAFSYAAAGADTVYDVPTDNENYNALDASIPFYQLVFSGSRTLISPAVNTADNAARQMMLAAQGGLKLNYDLIADFDVTDLEISGERLYAMLFSEQSETLQKQVAEYARLYAKVWDARLVDYRLSENGVGISTFSNGVTVLTNDSNVPVEYNGIVLDAYGYVAEDGGI